MQVRRYSLTFKQNFLGGYRYLDRCGEFLLRAEDEMGMIPSGDQSPSGGKMEHPESGLKLEFNTTFFRLTQDEPKKESVFTDYVTYFSSLYSALFTPRSIERNGVALQSFIHFDDLAVAERESLVGGSIEEIVSVAKAVGMVPAARNREYHFKSGSRHLTIKTFPATFEKVQSVLKNSAGRATAKRQEVVARQNIVAKRVMEQTLKHALFFDFDLIEDNPPEDGVSSLIAELLEKETATIDLIYPRAK